MQNKWVGQWIAGSGQLKLKGSASTCCPNNALPHFPAINSKCPCSAQQISHQYPPAALSTSLFHMWPIFVSSANIFNMPPIFKSKSFMCSINREGSSLVFYRTPMETASQCKNIPCILPPATNQLLDPICYSWIQWAFMFLTSLPRGSLSEALLKIHIDYVKRTVLSDPPQRIQ